MNLARSREKPNSDKRSCNLQTSRWHSLISVIFYVWLLLFCFSFLAFYPGFVFMCNKNFTVIKKKKKERKLFSMKDLYTPSSFLHFQEKREFPKNIHQLASKYKVERIIGKKNNQEVKFSKHNNWYVKLQSCKNAMDHSCTEYWLTIWTENVRYQG